MKICPSLGTDQNLELGCGLPPNYRRFYSFDNALVAQEVFPKETRCRPSASRFTKNKQLATKIRTNRNHGDDRSAAGEFCSAFVLCNRLSEVMKKDNTGKNTSSMFCYGRQVYRDFKEDRHPHTNMAKALNMLTHTAAGTLAKDGIL
jgi:hypothetical protein